MTTKHLSANNITQGYDDPRWLGWGYLGERSRATDDAAEIASADAYVIARAAERGWDAEDLFHWMNSKDGRWFGDWFFGSGDERREYPWVARLFPDHPERG